MFDHAEQLDSVKAALAERYRVERELGRGGMATVYLAEDLRHERSVAVKVLRPELAAALGSDRFLREIKLTARLDHPHILPLLDSGEADGFLFYVMPYVDGESLRERLNREKQLPIEDAIQITRDVADALAFAHQHDVVHRDIKPENILLAAGHARVADFGIARAVSAAGSDRLTETGLAVGTPAYMSPEQAVGESDLDGRGDIYALGCVLYEMLAGRPPFTGPTVESIVRQHVAAEVPSVATIRPAVSRIIAAAIGRALAKTAADRFGTAREFGDALRKSTGSQDALTPVLTPERRLRIPVLSTVTVLVVLAVGTWWLLRAGGVVRQRPDSLAVLPLRNQTGDAQAQPFVEGMHAELIDELLHISALDLRGRRQTTGYRDTEMSVPQIAHELGVDALLDGEVFAVGASLSVRMELISATGSLLWGGTYERDRRDVLSLYREIAHEVAQTFELELTPVEERRLLTVVVVVPEAHEQYILGRYHQRRALQQNFDSALVYFQRALTLDSTFAPAWAGLADTYVDLAEYHLIPASAVLPLAMTTSSRAVALDDRSAEAWSSVGYVRYAVWDFDGAAEAFGRAVALKPRDALVRVSYALVLMFLGRGDEALAQAERARELDRDPLIQFRAVSVWTHLGRAAEVTGRVDSLMQAHPAFPIGLWHLANFQGSLGRYEDAIASLQTQIPLMQPDIVDETGLLGFMYGMTGQKAKVQEMREQLDSLAEQGRFVSPVIWSFVYIGLRDHDEAFRQLERAVLERDLWLPYLGVWFVFDLLRSDPRFAALLTKVGLET
jgi:serine/threonine-protein kinase